MTEARLLVVDDDPKIRRLLQSQLTSHGYAVEAVGSGPEAVSSVEVNEPQLVVLDLELPGMDGIEVCKCLREWSTVPVVLLTANDGVEVKISALDAGADDYLTKPFHIGELLARIRTVLRRSQPSADNAVPAVFKLGELTIHMAQREVCRNEEPVHLTRTEFDLLSELIRHADRVLTYDHLLQAVWGPAAQDIHSVHVHVSNLRRKLEKGPAAPRHVLAVPGVGYRLRT